MAKPRKQKQWGDYSSLDSLISKYESDADTFPETVEKSSQQYKPYILANYLFQLSKKFNDFYNECKCIDAKGKIKTTRLNLVKATKQVLKNGLLLLNIDTVEKM